MTRVSQTLDRVQVTFDDDNLVANAGLLLPTTLVERLGLEGTVALFDLGARPTGEVSISRSDRGGELVERRCEP